MSKKSGAQRRAERTRALGGDAAGQQEEAGRSSPPPARGVRGLPTESLRSGALRVGDEQLFCSDAVWTAIAREVKVYRASGLAGRLTEDQAMALAITGRTLGIPVTQALQHLRIEDGHPAMSGELMRAKINASGVGHIEWVRLEAECVTGLSVRYGQGGRPDRETEFTWDKARAERAGLWGRGEYWQKYSQNMLLNRTTSDIGRADFSDVLAGVCYTSEELGGVPDVSAASVASLSAPAIPRQDPPKTPPPGKLARTPSGIPVPAPGGSQDPATAGPPVSPEAIMGVGQGVGLGYPPSVAPARSPALAGGTPDMKPEVSDKSTQRALTTVLHGEASGGGVATILTAGLTKPQLQLLKAMTTPEGGHPAWERHRAHGAAYVKAKGLPSVLHLTEAEGHELIGELSAAAPARDPARAAAEAELERVIVAAGQERQLVVDTLCRLHGVGTLDDLDTAALVHATDEVREMTKDQAQMALVLERLRSQSEIGA